MNAKTNILVILDHNSDAQQDPALLRAVYLAQKTGAALELFFCEYNPALYSHMINPRSGDEISPEDYLREAQTRLFHIAEPLREQGLTITTDSVWNRHYYAGVMEKVAAAEPDLVIKSTQNQGNINHSLFRYSDWHLIRECPAPLWLVNNDQAWNEPITLLASIDPVHVHGNAAELDTIIMNWGKRLSEDMNAELHAFHSIEYMPEPLAISGSYTSSYGEYQEMTIQSSRERVDTFLAPYRVGLTGEHIVEGSPDERMPETVANVNADLVIMGAIAKGTLSTLLIGSTAEHVLNKLKCDVLLVKQEHAQ